MLTYGSVSRAVYQAYEQAPNDANVLSTIRAGLTLDEYDSRLPDDVAFYLRDFYNAFHQGVQVTFAEVQRASRNQSRLFCLYPDSRVWLFSGV